MLYFPIKMIACFYMHSKIYNAQNERCTSYNQTDYSSRLQLFVSIMNKVDHKAVKINLLFGFLSCSGHPTPRARPLR